MYVCKTRIGASQTGGKGLQTLVSVLDVMQDCSQFWLESEPGLVAFMERDNIAMFLASRQLDVIKYAQYGEELTVKTGIYECKNYFGYRNTAVYGPGEELYAVSWCQGVFVSRETGRPSKLPLAVTEGLVYDEKLAMEYLPRKISVPDAKAEPLASIKTTPFDIDMNRHVNNVRYVQKACDCLPGYEDFNRLRIEYKLAAKLGEVMFPFVHSSGNAKVLNLCNEAGKVYCCVEFSNAAV